jgi:hypothetical protein
MGLYGTPAFLFLIKGTPKIPRAVTKSFAKQLFSIPIQLKTLYRKGGTPKKSGENSIIRL